MPAKSYLGQIHNVIYDSCTGFQLQDLRDIIQSVFLYLGKYQTYKDGVSQPWQLLKSSSVDFNSQNSPFISVMTYDCNGQAPLRP